MFNQSSVIMKTTRKSQSLVNSADYIYKKRDGLFGNNIIDKTTLKHLNVVSNFFEVSEKMAAVLSIIIIEQLLGDGQSVRKILRDLSISPIDAIGLYNELKILRIKGWIVEIKSRLSRHKDMYEFPKKTIEAITVNDKSLLIATKIQSQEDALAEMSSVFNQHCTDPDREELVELFMHHITSFNHFPVFKKVLQDKNLTNPEQILIIYMASDLVTNRNEIVNLSWVVDRIFQHPYWLHKIQKRLSTDGYLIIKNYIAYSEPDVVDIDTLKLGEAITDLLDVSCKTANTEPIFKLCEPIYPASIDDVELFFNEKNRPQYEEIKHITSKASYDRIVETFKQEGLPTGIAILLSGLPGTGKTETVKQIAKLHNRVILMVDISKFKSMWLGETEKNIKRIFNEYESACNYYDTKPILLFNEADAILGKRSTVNSTVEQTMNNIQNILLQQMEDFKGILMATTNLKDNLDLAFDRRFIIKFSFEIPDQQTRLSIIKKQLPTLSDELQNIIASSYQLTGAQIQNIKRRIIAKRVLKGDFVMDKIELESLIVNEVNVQSNSTIGFVFNSHYTG